MLIAGVGSQGTGIMLIERVLAPKGPSIMLIADVGSLWRVLAPKGLGIMLIAGVGSLGTGYNVDSWCWLPRDWV